MRKLYRVYYTTYDDGVHRRVLEELRKRYGNVVDKKSRVLQEFRFIEIYIDKEGLSDEIASVVRSVPGVTGVKVDWIDTSK